MPKRPKPPQLTWRDVRRQAVDDAARDALVDPEASESLVADAAKHLNTSTEITAGEVAAIPVDALRFLRDLLRGEARYPGAALIAMPLPTAPAVVDQGDEQDELVTAPAEPVAKPEAKQPTKPEPYSQTLPTKRVITSGKYLDDDDTIRQRAKDDVRKLK